MCLADILVFAVYLVIILFISACVGFFGSFFAVVAYGFVEAIEGPRFLSVLLGIIVEIVVVVFFILAAEMIPWHPLYALFAIIFGVIFLVFFIRSES